METLTIPSPLLFVLSGPVIFSQCSSYRSVVGRLGAQVFLAADRLFYMRAHSTDEDQSMVRTTQLILSTCLTVDG